MLSGALKRLIALPCAFAAFAAGAQTAWAYQNPFSGNDAYIGRTDMGVDVCLTPGDPVRAVGAGVVVGVIKDWYDGQPYIWYELTAGSHAGQYVYVAEQIDHLLRPGAKLQTGDVVARYAKHGTCLETGWSTAGGETLAAATTGYKEGQVTEAGASFARFLVALGVPGQFELSAPKPQIAHRKPKAKKPKPKPSPAAKPPTTPAPATRPATTPATKPATTPATKPATAPAKKPATKPTPPLPPPAQVGSSVQLPAVTAGSSIRITLTSPPSTSGAPTESASSTPWWTPAYGYGPPTG